jgi:hypothetical protein
MTTTGWRSGATTSFLMIFRAESALRSPISTPPTVIPGAIRSFWALS